jgi:hypothetical protein
MCVCKHTHTHTYMYMYMYTYIYNTHAYIICYLSDLGRSGLTCEGVLIVKLYSSADFLTPSFSINIWSKSKPDPLTLQ